MIKKINLIIWVLSLYIACENLVTNKLVAGYINTGSSCTVTIPGLTTGDLTNINNCRSGLCSGGTCVDQCTGIDQGAFGQPCTIGTANLCCADTFHCDLANISRTNIIPGTQSGTQCCIAGAVSPGNPKMACKSDADCCQNAICTPSPDQNSYCVTCATSGETCNNQVLCCNNQQLNCVSGICESCIGQSCAAGTGAACCPESIVPGITCGANQVGTDNVCCVKTNFGCAVDQDCCAGNNCIVDSTSNNTQGVCTACGSKVGDSCSQKQPCCSSSPTLSCLITDSGPDATGTCQNMSCVLNSDCNSGYYCDLNTDLTKSASCTTCLNSTCTGVDGTACDHDCDPDLYECQSTNCVRKATAGSDASGWMIANIVVGTVAIVGVLVISWKLYRARNDTGTFKNQPKLSVSFFTDPASATGPGAGQPPSYTIDLIATPADQAVLLQALKTAAIEDYAQAEIAACVTENTNSPTPAGILKAYKAQGFGKNFIAIWGDYMRAKIAAIDIGKPMDPVTIEILRAFARAGLLQRASATSYNTVTLKPKRGSNVVIKFPENSADYIAQNLLQTLPDRAALAPDSPELNKQAVEFIKSMVLNACSESPEDMADRPKNLTDWLSNQKNMDLMRDMWSATYFKLVKDGISEPKAADIIKYLIENSSFKTLFNIDSPFNSTATALAWLADQSVPAGSDYFIEQFKRFPPSYQQATAGDNSYDRVVSAKYYDQLIDALKTADPVSLRNFRIAAILAGKGNFGAPDSFTPDDLRDMAYSYRQALRGWGPSDYANYTSAKLFSPV